MPKSRKMPGRPKTDGMVGIQIITNRDQPVEEQIQERTDKRKPKSLKELESFTGVINQIYIHPRLSNKMRTTEATTEEGDKLGVETTKRKSIRRSKRSDSTSDRIATLQKKTAHTKILRRK